MAVVLVGFIVGHFLDFFFFCVSGLFSEGQIDHELSNVEKFL